MIKCAIFEMGSNNIYHEPLKPYSARYDYHAVMVTEVVRDNLKEVAEEDYEIFLLPPTREGFQWAIDNGVQLTNMSMTGSIFALNDERKLSEQAVMITSAGNDGAKGEGTSARQEWWIAVGSVDIEEEPRDYSSWGFDKVLTVAIDGQSTSRGICKGTSCAAPVIFAEVLKYMINFQKEFNFIPTYKTVREFIKFNSSDIFEKGIDQRTGYGLFVSPKKYEFESYKIDDSYSTYLFQNEHEVEGLTLPKYTTLCEPREVLERNGSTVNWNKETGITVVKR